MVWYLACTEMVQYHFLEIQDLWNMLFFLSLFFHILVKKKRNKFLPLLEVRNNPQIILLWKVLKKTRLKKIMTLKFLHFIPFLTLCYFCLLDTKAIHWTFLLSNLFDDHNVYQVPNAICQWSSWPVLQCQPFCLAKANDQKSQLARNIDWKP